MFLVHSLFLLCSLVSLGQVFGFPSPYTDPLPHAQRQQPDNKAKKSAPVHFPLRKRSKLGKRGPTGRRILTIKELAEIRRRDLERQSHIRRRSTQKHEKKSSWETVGVTNYEGDSFYYISMQIGTPPQTIDVAIDTGSSDLWVAASNCEPCQTNLTEPSLDGSEASFNYQASTSFQASSPQRAIPLEYADGTAIDGIIAQDKVSIGQYSYPNQIFVLALAENSDFDVAGLMGLGWPALAASEGTPWWLNVLDQFAAPEFSMFLTDAPLTATASEGGQFTLGGRNSSLYDVNITFIPLLQESWWTIPLESIIVNSNSEIALSGDYASTIIDSGTTLIYGPDDAVESFYAAIPGSQRGETLDPSLAGLWVVPCTTVINPQFKFNNNATFTVPTTNFLYGQISTGSQYCLASLAGNGGLSPTPTAATTAVPNSSQILSPPWTLGETYMRSVYTVFRKGANGEQPSVGFAPIKGVNYNTDASQTIGVGSDGVNGGIGSAGVTIIGTGQPTQAPNTGSGSSPNTALSNGHTSGGNQRLGIMSGRYLMWTVLLVTGYAVSW